jgi:catechol 2,3-dioxygenase-like lactoylglutathione lyase family enzyme
MTNGFDHVYLETHHGGAAVAFWQQLGFQLEFDTGHGSGMLRNPGGGPAIFLAEQSIEDPLASELYLGATADYEPPADVIVVSPFTDTHWGTKVMVVQDPDGHRFRIEAPAGD